MPRFTGALPRSYARVFPTSTWRRFGWLPTHFFAGGGSPSRLSSSDRPRYFAAWCAGRNRPACGHVCDAGGERRYLSPIPPMGWNSLVMMITEVQAIEHGTVMARELLPAGYDIFVIDDGMNRARRAPRMRRSRCLAQPPVSGGPELFC